MKKFRFPVFGRSVGWLIVVFAIAFVLSAKYGARSLPVPDEDVQVSELTTVPDCDPTTTRCNAVQGTAVIGLTFAGPVRALTPFASTVSVAGIDGSIRSVKVSFTMRDMDMGRNVYDLAPDDKAAAWKANALLPVCTSGRSDWLAEVEVRGAGRLYKATFPFRVH